MFHPEIPENDFHVLNTLEMSSFENCLTDELKFLSSSSQISVAKYSVEDELSQDEHHDESGGEQSQHGRKNGTPDSGGYGCDFRCFEVIFTVSTWKFTVRV